MVTLFDLIGSEETPTTASAVPYWYDPRPDLTGDTVSWQVVLELAFALDGEAASGVFGALHGMRCNGARIVQAGSRHRLASGEAYEGEWAEDCARWLVRYREPIAALLKAVTDGD